MKKSVISLVVLLLLSIILAVPAFAASGMTDGGYWGEQRIYYDLSFSPSYASASTTPTVWSPDPNVHTTVEARYWTGGGDDWYVDDDGTTSASVTPPVPAYIARSWHIASSAAWGEFDEFLIRP